MPDSKEKITTFLDSIPKAALPKADGETDRQDERLQQLRRIADALEHIAYQQTGGAIKTSERPAHANQVDRMDSVAPASQNPGPSPAGAGSSARFLRFDGTHLVPARVTRPVPLANLLGIDRQKQQLLENTRRLARGLPAHHTLLWGSRGSGKSSLLKAVCHQVAKEEPMAGLMIVQAAIEEDRARERLLNCLWQAEGPVVLFADEFSLEANDPTVRQLKSLLDGGLEELPAWLKVYATSNRKHLMRREARENEPLRPKEDQDEKISLSDRFGLLLGFYPADQDLFFDIIEVWLCDAGFKAEEVSGTARERWQAQAVEWSMQRGARSGRAAKQFADEYLARSRMES